jgi:hypothetical protein
LILNLLKTSVINFHPHSVFLIGCELTTSIHGASYCVVYVELTTSIHGASYCVVYVELTTSIHGASYCAVYVNDVFHYFEKVWSIEVEANNIFMQVF